MPTTFPDLLARARASATIEVTPDWAQGRSTFGGLVVALALERMRDQVDPARRPRSLLVAFVGPVAAGRIDIEVERLRVGRSATQVEARVIQAGAVCCTITAAFADDRESKLAIVGRPAPELRGPEGLHSLPHIPGVTPGFVQYLELRWALGSPPYSRTDMHEHAGWCRFREAGRASESHVLALADAWPTPVLQRLREVASASSMTWMIEFPEFDAEADAAAWWRFHVDTDHAAGGWVHTHAALWSPSGKLAALSHQTVAVFG